MFNSIKIDCVVEDSYIMVYPILHALPVYGKEALVEMLGLKTTHKVNIFNSIFVEIIACTQTLFYFSFRFFRKHRRPRERSEFVRTSAEREKEK